jgi:hypothetical protein
VLHDCQQLQATQEHAVSNTTDLVKKLRMVNLYKQNHARGAFSACVHLASAFFASTLIHGHLLCPAPCKLQRSHCPQRWKF